MLRAVSQPGGKPHVRTGFIIISDITGYTVYLSETELEHAEGVLRTLMEVLLKNTDAPPVVSRLEGDAVISYVTRDILLQSQTLIEKIENIYIGFRRALEQMILNTSCDCNACRKIPDLDLKFFVHFGDFVIQQLGGHRELLGKDVNLTFRLVKNHITSRTGLQAYVAYTGAAIEALGLPEFAAQLVRHEESYDDVGPVTLHLQGTHTLWEEQRNRGFIEIRPEEALFKIEEDFPLPPAQLWDYLTRPDFRAIIFGSEAREVEGKSSGRHDVDTVYICAHGDTRITHTVVEWQPFVQYSFISESVPGASNLYSFRLSPIDKGTHLEARVRKTEGSIFKRKFVDLVNRRVIAKAAPAGLAALKAKIEEDLATGQIRTPEAAALSLPAKISVMEDRLED